MHGILLLPLNKQLIRYICSKFTKTKIFKNMKTVKMSLANLQGKMSRNEMRNIMAGEVTCYRSNGSVNDSFTSSSAVMGAWAGFWDAAGWSVRCTNGFHNNVQFC